MNLDICIKYCKKIIGAMAYSDQAPVSGSQCKPKDTEAAQS